MALMWLLTIACKSTPFLLSKSLYILYKKRVDLQAISCQSTFQKIIRITVYNVLKSEPMISKNGKGCCLCIMNWFTIWILNRHFKENFWPFDASLVAAFTYIFFNTNQSLIYLLLLENWFFFALSISNALYQYQMRYINLPINLFHFSNQSSQHEPLQYCNSNFKRLK